jgi:hypothetical protein
MREYRKDKIDAFRFSDSWSCPFCRCDNAAQHDMAAQRELESRQTVYCAAAFYCAACRAKWSYRWDYDGRAVIFQRETP